MDHRRSRSRREILAMALALGGNVLSKSIDSIFAQERRPTPPQTLGPYYPVLKPLDRDADLTLVTGRLGCAQGQVIHVTGRVVNLRGEPVRGAQIEIWQANMHGRYDHPSDSHNAPLDPNFQGYSIQSTDEQGRCHFKTIKPGAYPSIMNHGNIRAPHIHFDVFGRFDRLVTQMYFSGEPLNDQDAVFRMLGQNKADAISQVLPPTKEIERGALLLSWDIVLESG
jgi:protocatechuate 3,4-dioxygenase, beta subunit